MQCINLIYGKLTIILFANIICLRLGDISENVSHFRVKEII